MRKKFEFKRKPFRDKGSRPFYMGDNPPEWFQILWETRCNKCGSREMNFYLQEIFNVYYSRTGQIICAKCGNLVQELTESGAIH